MNLPSSLSQNLIFLLIISGLLIFCLTYFAPLETKNGDFTYSLLVSQAILEHHTVQLDAYKDKVDQNRHFDHDYRIEKVNDHYYYLFPLAPSVVLTPAVWAANWLGQKMFIQEQEYALLKLMAALSCTLILIIIYALCRCYLAPLPSLVVALVSMLGTNLVSSLGTAFSSMNLAVLFVFLSLLLIALFDTGRIKTINPYLLGLLLFVGFWSRPTVAPFILVVFAYIFFRQRTIFLRLAITAFIPLLLFLAWSWLTYGQLLPYFYTPNRLLETPAFGVAFYGNALSPARGLFVFSPFFALVLVGALWFFHDLKKDDLFWLSLVWFILYYIAIARKNEDWWDGHNYGPRVLIDGMPALILLTLLLWRVISRRASLTPKVIALSSYAILSVGAIFIHSYQGLYNPSTNLWNKDPNIDRYPEYLFDWKYPQFLASEQSLRQRKLEHQQKRLTPYALGNTITYQSKEVVFWEWYEPETGWRWTKGISPRIVFKLGKGVILPDKQYIMEFLGASIKSQKVGVSLNDTQIGELTLEAFTGNIPKIQTLLINGTQLQENELNNIEFYLPNGAISENEQGRTSGMAFVSLKIYPLTGDPDGVHYFESEFFQTGFSSAEKEWRWTDGAVSNIIYPIDAVDINKKYELEIISGAFGVQDVKIILNGIHIGDLTFKNFGPEPGRLTFEGNLLKANDNNKIQLLISNATVPEGDSRRLGLAFVSLKIYPPE